MRLILILTFLITSFTSFTQTITNYTSTDGLASDNVYCVDVDANGVVWFGTQAGISAFDNGTWTTYNTSNVSELPNNTILAIAAFSNGDIWIGTDFGAAKYDGNSWTQYTTAEGLGNNRINYITEGSNGDVWFSDFGGATHFDGTTFTVYNTGSGLPFGGVRYIAEASNGDILMATGLDGLFSFDGSTFTEETDSVVSQSATAVAIDNDGNTWLGTGSGITVLNTSLSFLENHTRMYIMPPPDTLNPIEDIKIDRRGNVWAGIYVDYLVSVGGVAMYNGSTWVDYDETDGLVGPNIRRLALDGDDNLWVATSSGVSMIESPHASTQDLKVEQAINIYPNPSNGIVHVQVSDNSLDIQEIRVVDTRGIEVLRQATAGKQDTYQLNLEGLSPGVYYVQAGNFVRPIFLD